MFPASWNRLKLNYVIRLARHGGYSISASRWRYIEKATSPFGFSIPILLRWSTDIFHLSLAIQKLYRSICAATRFSCVCCPLAGDGLAAPTPKWPLLLTCFLCHVCLAEMHILTYSPASLGKASRPSNCRAVRDKYIYIGGWISSNLHEFIASDM
jgi:hypothetical protein